MISPYRLRIVDCGFRIVEFGLIRIVRFLILHYFLFRAVFIDDTTIDKISLHSRIKGAIEFLSKISTSSITSNQNNVSSASSSTIPILAMNSALDHPLHAAR